MRGRSAIRAGRKLTSPITISKGAFGGYISEGQGGGVKGSVFLSGPRPASEGSDRG